MADTETNAQSFALLSVESVSQDTGDKDLERAFQSLSLKQRLEAIQTAMGSDDAKLAFLPGAGAVYMPGCKYAVVEDRWMAMFTGEIENYSYLVKKYCLAEAGLDPQGQYLLETVKALSPLNDAQERSISLLQVVAVLFKKLGPTFMSKLKGRFTFAVYDSTVGRVLAANDCNGTGSVWQAHADDCLVVACNMEVPTIQVEERTAIAAGEYKFGWRASPVAYMSSHQAVQSRCNEAMQAAMAALASANGPLASTKSGPFPPPSAPVPASTRRCSKTMPRRSFQGNSRVSLSAGSSSVSSKGPWHIPGNVSASPGSSQTRGGPRGGSYVPPHRRSQQFGPSHSPYAPCATNWGLSRSSTSSASGTSWRRSTSDATCRPHPEVAVFSGRDPSATETATLRRLSAPGIRPHVAAEEEDPSATSAATVVPKTNSSECTNSNGTSLHDVILLAGDDDEEDCAATTMDSWRLAASSMFFQPAKMGSNDRDRSQSTAPAGVGAAPGVVIAAVPSPPGKTSGNGESPEPLSNGTAQQAVEPMELQADATATAVRHNTVALLRPSPIYIPAASSPACLEAKRLLDLAAQCVDGENTAAMLAYSSKHDCAAPKTGAVATQPAQPQQPLLGLSNSTALAEASEAAAAAVNAHQQAPAPAMTSSGSFSDALALLLRARSPKTLSPAAPESASPTDAAPPSGLSASKVCTGVCASAVCVASHEPEASQDKLDCEGPVKGTSKGEVQQEKGGVNGTQRLPELDESLRSVSAGVSWQFGDRLIPSALLQELAGGKDALVGEQAALASLVYSSPCAVCIVDVREKHQPVVHVNLLFERQTGYTAEEMLGKNCRFLQVKPGAKRSSSVTSIAIHRAVESGRSYCGKILNYHKDGTPLWNQLSLVPVRCTKSLKVTHYIGMQSFTKAEPLVATAAPHSVVLLRGSSHECLKSLESELASMKKLGKKSSSHMQLSALNTELMSSTSLPVCGALNLVRSCDVSTESVPNKAPSLRILSC